MKYLLFIATIFVPISSMEITQAIPKIRMRDRDLDTSIRPFITIINALPVEDTYLPNKQIDITDKSRTNSYKNEPYKPDFFAISLLPGEGIRFSPYKDSAFAEHERLGMNNNENAALIQLYVHAAIKYQLMNLYVGKHSKIKFGDTVRFGLESDGTIIMKHNHKTLKKIDTQHTTEIIGAPKDRTTRSLEPLLLTLSNPK
jgi:hypothetical protein